MSVYSGKYLRIDLSEHSWREVAISETEVKSWLLGSGLAARIFYDEMDPDLDPLDPASPLLVFNGVLTGTFAPTGALVDPAIGAVGDIDTTMITLWYRNGAIGSIDNSRKAVYGYDQRVEVFGSEGVVIVGNDKPNTAVVSDSTGVHGSLPLFFFVERYTEFYLAEMRAFIASVLEDRTPSVTGIDGRIPVVMGYAAKKSFDESRPVKLSEIEL